MRKFGAKLILLTGVAFSVSYLAALPAYGQDTRGKSDVASNSLEQRGRQLRAAVEQEYKRLESLKLLTMTGNDITDVVTKYIPIGTSFDDGEQILRAAGFAVEPRPPASAKDDDRRGADVVAVIDNLVSKYSFAKTSIVIFLHPKTPGDYSKVSGVDAGIATTTL